MRKKISALVSLVLVLSLTAPTSIFLGKNAVAAETGEVVVDIYHTNDVHSRTANYPVLAAFVGEAKAQNENTLLLDAGDTLHGQTIATLEEGTSIVKMMNGIGYDAATPGNHDFNYGYLHLVELTKQMEFPELSSNVYKDGKPLLEPYKIFELPVAKVAVIGATTPETTYSTHPDNVKGLEFKDPVEEVKKAVEEVKDKADVIIVLAHIGINESSAVTTKDIAEKVAGIDVIIDGHSHSELADGIRVGDTLIAQTGEYLNNIGHVSITLSGGEKTAAANLIKVEDLNTTDESAPNYIKPNEEVKKIIEDIEKSQEALLSVVVANTPYDLQGDRESVRTGATNLSDLISDIIKEETNADIALNNGGNIRDTIPAGDITKGQIITVLPFGNYIVTKEVTGADMLAVMEHGLASYPEQAGGFPQFAGMKVTFDPSKPVGSRVTEILVNDAPIDLNAVYVLATNDFLAAGGDGYEMLNSAKELGEFSALDEVVIKHLGQGFPIPEKTDGRLVMLEANEAPAVAVAQPEQPAPSAGLEAAPALVEQPAPVSQPKETDTSYYTVKAGDNLTKIASNYGMTWREVYELNKDIIQNPNLIYPGQIIKVEKAS